VSAFYFVDVIRPRRPRSEHAELLPVQRMRVPGYDRFRNRSNGNEFDVYRLEQRGEDGFVEIPRLGVFFHRGDTLAKGEGSSGVPWLGREWLTSILGKLVPGGFLVTDGSNLPSNGPSELGAFHDDRTIGARAVWEAQSFEFAGRVLECVGYAGDRNGPTLVWRAA
jgi:hypothetical protein